MEVSRGYIRAVLWLAESETAVYHVAGNRHCERIGRQHRSNNIAFVVDTRRRVLHQECMDQECEGFKFAPQRLPGSAIDDYPAVAQKCSEEQDPIAVDPELEALMEQMDHPALRPPPRMPP